MKAVGRDYGGGGWVEAMAEGEGKASAKELLGGGCLAAESVDDPLTRSGPMATGGGEEEIIGADGMDYEGLAEFGCEVCMEVEECGLCGDVGSAEAVEATFADGHNAWVTGIGHELL